MVGAVQNYSSINYSTPYGARGLNSSKPKKDAVEFTGNPNEQAPGYKKTKVGKIVGLSAGVGVPVGAMLINAGSFKRTLRIVQLAAINTGLSVGKGWGIVGGLIGLCGLVGLGLGAIVDKCINSARKKKAQA